MRINLNKYMEIYDPDYFALCKNAACGSTYIQFSERKDTINYSIFWLSK